MTLGNYGTYGLPVILFAFGEEGLSYAVLFFVVSVLLQATLGVGIAAARKGQKAWQPILSIVRVPWVYAFALSVGLRALGLRLPTGLERAMELVAGGAIPMQLLLLGMELSRLRLRQMAEATIELALERVFLAPVLAAAIAVIPGLQAPVASILILQASMPSAINSMILAVKYERHPELAAGVVLVGTLASMGTITLLLYLLR